MKQQPKILAVDDTPQNLKLLDAILTPRGYIVVPASSGYEALAKVATEQPDLVLLDILMPGIDGYEVCRKLRDDPVTHLLPIVMVTASGDEQKVRAIEAGADDFIAKPLNQAELLARIRSLIRIKTYHDTIQAQAEQLTEWNRTLEARVQQQVAELQAAQAQLVEKQMLEQELRMAYEIQVSILPRTFPCMTGYDFAARMAPARAVGGDFFDFIQLDHGRLGIAIGDVTDKGMPAAIFMAQTHALLRAEASRATSPREALQHVNRHLLAMNDANLFVTVLYGVLDPAANTFSYARAGHELPLICTRAGEAKRAAKSATLPLGIDADVPLDEQSIPLGPGDTILLYTDGVTDARDPRGIALGVPRLGSALRTSSGRQARDTCDQVLQAVADHQGLAPQQDDVTLVVCARLNDTL